MTSATESPQAAVQQLHTPASFGGDGHIKHYCRLQKCQKYDPGDKFAFKNRKGDEAKKIFLASAVDRFTVWITEIR
jgi:hypothetical protein